ncbi:MAG: hypothetical protein MR606_04905 [Mollicutes bacterium]|nr:hypothetical protein [Mollicutes bacterium]
MNVELIKPYGFCTGALKAIDLVKKVRKDNPDNNIILFGPILHNENINELMNNLKIKVLDLPYEAYSDVIDTLSIDDIVILPAHGHDNYLEEKLLRKGILYVDATCPIIKKIHDLILIDYADRDIIYIGKKSHIEAITTTSLKENIFLFDINYHTDLTQYHISKPIILYQTTLTKYDVKDSIKIIKKIFPDAQEGKTLCRQCTIRQNNLIKSLDDNVFVIVVGSKNSSNTISLLNIYYKTTKNENIMLVNSLDEVKKMNFNKNYKYIITSGTSTPNSIVESIYKYIRSL